MHFFENNSFRLSGEVDIILLAGLQAVFRRGKNARAGKQRLMRGEELEEDGFRPEE